MLFIKWIIQKEKKNLKNLTKTKKKKPTNKKPQKTHPKKKPAKDTQDQTPDDDLLLKIII